MTINFIFNTKIHLFSIETHFLHNIQKFFNFHFFRFFLVFQFFIKKVQNFLYRNSLFRVFFQHPQQHQLHQLAQMSIFWNLNLFVNNISMQIFDIFSLKRHLTSQTYECSYSQRPYIDHKVLIPSIVDDFRG